MTRYDLPADLDGPLAAYAERQGVDVEEAAALLIRAALAIGDADRVLATIQERTTIWALIPDAEDEGDLLSILDDAGMVDQADYTLDGRLDAVGYRHVRGAWVYYDTTRGELHSEQHEIVADEETARQMMREEILRVTAKWSPGDEPIWDDCGYDDDMLERMVYAGEVPPDACHCGPKL